MRHVKREFICCCRELDKETYLIRHIEYRKHPHTAIIFKFNGAIYAYVNHCMHMQRALDCMQDTIFDASGNLLRCSMHGFVFEPTSGECLSPVCQGQKLQSIKIIELEGLVYFADKHVSLMLCE